VRPRLHQSRAATPWQPKTCPAMTRPPTDPVGGPRRRPIRAAPREPSSGTCKLREVHRNCAPAAQAIASSVFTRSTGLHRNQRWRITLHATPVRPTAYKEIARIGRPRSRPIRCSAVPLLHQLAYDPARWQSFPVCDSPIRSCMRRGNRLRHGHPKPKNRTLFFMTGSSPLVALELCFLPESQPNPRSAHWPVTPL